MPDEIQPPSDADAQSHGRLQKCLDGFHDLRCGVVNRLAYVSLRLYGFEGVSLSDISRGAYDGGQHKNRELENVHNTKLVLSAAKECFDEAQERRSAITDKCKTLLTVSSILLGLIGLLLPKSFAFDAIWMRVVFFVAILGLLNVIVLLLTFFSVGRECRITLDQSDIDLGSEDFEKNRINLYLQCQVAIDNRTDYLVDLYKVARFFFLASFSFVVVLFSVSFLSNSARNDAKDIIRELRSNPELIELLRGPKGVQGGKGDTGERGENGLRGNTGATGERGQDAVFDEVKIIERLVNDPLLRKKLNEAIEARVNPKPPSE